MPRQFENPANPETHRRTSAREILRQVPAIHPAETMDEAVKKAIALAA